MIRRDGNVNSVDALPSWITSNLTSEQRAPLLRDAKHACIFASAGSGKTRTLVHMIANDLADGINPANIIAFTFTERAADELAARIQTLVQAHLSALDITSMYIGTIHGWCYKYLLEQTEFYGFEAIDELHVDSLVSRLYDQLGLKEIYKKPYPRGIESFIVDLEVYYNENLSLAEIPASIQPNIEQFTEILRANRLLPFGAMISHTIDHLNRRGPVQNLLRLYCDEYQDVNPAQVALMKAMINADTQVVAVGDDLQCIYQWRGSDVGRILDVQLDFPGAAIFHLTDNYRSRPAIVRVANQVAESIELRDPKIMVATRPTNLTDKICWLTTLDEEQQAVTVGEVVSTLIDDGVSPSKIAILLRSVVKHGQPIADELRRRNIPSESSILGRSGGFISSFLLPIVEWLSQDHQEPRSESEEEIAYQKIEKLWDTACIWLPENNDVELHFWDALNQWHDLIEAKDNRAYDVRGRLYDFLQHCGIGVAPGEHDIAAGLGIGTQIIRSVEEIHRRRIAGSPRRTPRGLMTEIYHALRRQEQHFGETEPIAPSLDAVLITTVHQAKGLEWPVVIIPAIDQGHFPVPASHQRTSYSEEIAGRYGTTLEDERRLFYVAVTRARERLVLVDATEIKPARRSKLLSDLADNGTISPTHFDDIPSTSWSFDANDLKDPDKVLLSIGLSDLLMAVECPFQFGLRRRAGIQPSIADELGYGKGLHELIQRRFESATPWSTDDLHREVQSHVHLPYMSENEEQQARTAINNRLLLFERLEVFHDHLEAEVAVQVPVASGVISGIIDGVFLQVDGSVAIRDWKTNIHPELLPRYLRQLQFYAYALRCHSVQVSKAELIDVGTSLKTVNLTSIDVDVSPQATRELVQHLEETLSDIAQGDYSPHPKQETCLACDLNRICRMKWKQ
jgi:DNA helicase-2/ATP-dependent DNA helicase PcrA